MREALSKALAVVDDPSVEKILAASFWLPAKPRSEAKADVVLPAERRAEIARASGS